MSTSRTARRTRDRNAGTLEADSPRSVWVMPLEQGIDDPLDREDADPPSPALREVGKPPNRARDAGPLPTPAGLKIDGGAGISQGRLAASDPIGQSLRKIWQPEGPLKITPLLCPSFRGDRDPGVFVERLSVRSGDGWTGAPSMLGDAGKRFPGCEPAAAREAVRQ